MFLYVKLFVEKIFLHFCETIFSSFHLKKTSFSLFPFLLGFFFTCFSMFGLFSVSWKMVSRFYNLPFFYSSFQLCFSFFSFLMYPKTRMCFCREMWEKLSFVFCFCSLGLKTFRVQKIRFIFPLFLKFLLESFSLFMKNHKRNSAIKPSFFCFCSVAFLFHFVPFNIFFHHFFRGSLFPSSFCSSLFDFLLFFLLSFLHSFFISPSPCFSFSFFLYLMFPYLFFFIAVVAYPLFISTHFSSLLLILISFFFSYFFFTFFFIISASFFCPKKIQKFLWSIFLHEIMSLFFEPSLLRCFISCFFLLESSSFLVVPCFSNY